MWGGALSFSECGCKHHTCWKLQLFAPLPHWSTELHSASRAELMLGEKSPQPSIFGQKAWNIGLKIHKGNKERLKVCKFWNPIVLIECPGGVEGLERGWARTGGDSDLAVALTPYSNVVSSFSSLPCAKVFATGTPCTHSAQWPAFGHCLPSETAFSFQKLQSPHFYGSSAITTRPLEMPFVGHGVKITCTA